MFTLVSAVNAELVTPLMYCGNGLLAGTDDAMPAVFGEPLCLSM